MRGDAEGGVVSWVTASGVYWMASEQPSPGASILSSPGPGDQLTVEGRAVVDHMGGRGGGGGGQGGGGWERGAWAVPVELTDEAAVIIP